MNPEKMTCKGGVVKVDAKIINLGTRDEDDVVVALTIPDLELETRKSGLTMDQDDYTRMSFSLTVPEGTEEGIYLVNMDTYFDGIAPSNSKTFNLAVEACETEPEPTTTTTTTTQPAVTTTPTQSDATAPSATVTPSKRGESSSFMESSGYLWLLGILIAAVIIVLVVLLVVVMRRPRK